MSRFLASKLCSLDAYTPGEQPRDSVYIKLNTNESPFPPSPGVAAAVTEAAQTLNLYSDPTCYDLNAAAAEYYGVSPEEILMTNGSDEILSFAFQAYGEDGFVFPDITYGFYPVFARLYGIDYETVPLTENFAVAPGAYRNIGKSIVIANPNAPTGMALTVSEIEDIVASNPDHAVIIDEAYIDFGGQTCLPLIRKYDNLLVTRTFSKSFSLAGARLGFGIGNPALIADLNRIKYSTNPYNINRMTMAAGTAALKEHTYYEENCRQIAQTRENTTQALRQLGFSVTDSVSNFLFAAHPAVDGDTLYRRLKEKRILVRHFDAPRIRNYNRITVGTAPQMDALLRAVKEILKECGCQ